MVMRFPRVSNLTIVQRVNAARVHRAGQPIGARKRRAQTPVVRVAPMSARNRSLARAALEDALENRLRYRSRPHSRRDSRPIFAATERVTRAPSCSGHSRALTPARRHRPLRRSGQGGRCCRSAVDRSPRCRHPRRPVRRRDRHRPDRRPDRPSRHLRVGHAPLRGPVRDPVLHRIALAAPGSTTADRGGPRRRLRREQVPRHRTRPPAVSAAG